MARAAWLSGFARWGLRARGASTSAFGPYSFAEARYRRIDGS